METTGNNEIILYQPNETMKLEVRLENDTVWLTQQQIANLFGTKRPAITKHLANIYKSGELEEKSTCSILEHMGNDGLQRYTTKHYNLDAILSVGYRVNSRNATLFRQWANKVLKEYLLRGYAVNQRLIEMSDRLDRRLLEQDGKIAAIRKDVDFFVRTSLPPKEGILFQGQIFDAHVIMSQLVEAAKKRIALIDNYVDTTVLTLLDKRKPGVTATIYTQEIRAALRQDLWLHNQQYPEITIHVYRRAHDRFLIIDETVYHIGASLKDLGKKLFAFSEMTAMTGSELLSRL